MIREAWEEFVGRLGRKLRRYAAGRPPDFIVGTVDDPYLRRWYLTPWSGMYRGIEDPTRWQRFVRALPNVYLHHFMRDDDDRAHHDHPWPSISLGLHGAVFEHTIAAGGVHNIRYCMPAGIRLRSAAFAHRLTLPVCDDKKQPCWTLFITGFATRHHITRVRGDWGFHCLNRWVHYKHFTDTRDGVSTVGRGCE